MRRRGRFRLGRDFDHDGIESIDENSGSNRFRRLLWNWRVHTALPLGCREGITAEVAQRHAIPFDQMTVSQRVWSKLDKPRPEFVGIKVGEVLYTNIEVSLPGETRPSYQVYCENPTAFPSHATHITVRAFEASGK